MESNLCLPTVENSPPFMSGVIKPKIKSGPVKVPRTVGNISGINIPSKFVSNKPKSSDDKRVHRNAFTPPIIRDNISPESINKSINSMISTSAPSLEPIIKKENIIPINDRPSSPKDETVITLNDIPMSRKLITPIEISDSMREDKQLHFIPNNDYLITAASPTTYLKLSQDNIENTSIFNLPTKTLLDKTPPIVNQFSQPKRQFVSSLYNKPISPIINQFSQPNNIQPKIPVMHQFVPQEYNVFNEVPMMQQYPPQQYVSQQYPSQQYPQQYVSQYAPQTIEEPKQENKFNLPELNIPNYDSMSLEEQAQHRANFINKFGILRSSWPNYDIPIITDNMSLKQIHAQYDVYIRHIHISKDMDNYKIYLVIVWLIVELFCTKIGLNVAGYTTSQMKSMNKYEKLLIELGETNYKSTVAANGTVQSEWPIEIRILFMTLTNAVVFIIIKMLANSIGEGVATNIVDGIFSYLSGTPPQSGQNLLGSNIGNVSQEMNGTSGAIPGGNSIPQMNNNSLFGGMDLTSLLGTMGSKLIQSQFGGSNQAPVDVQAPKTPKTPRTPVNRPVYDE